MRSAPLFTALALVLAVTPARADIPLDLLDRGSARITLDGLLRDWTVLTTLTAVDEPARVVRGAAAWQGPDDASFGYALARDGDFLWIAAEVRDDRVIRSRAHRDGEDALVVSLAVTAGGRAVGYDIALLPGEPGSYPGMVRFTGAHSGVLAGAQLVEAPLAGGGGFTLEARIPWRAIPEVGAGLATLRGRVAYFDTDTPARPVTETVIATGPGDGQHPMDMPAATGAVGDAGPGNLLNRFQMDHDLGSALAVLDRAADLAGDGQMERVVLFPRYLVAFGPGIARGQGYVFAELPSRAPADVLASELRDVTGDGHPEMVLRLRVPGEGYDRQIVSVYGIDDAGTLQRFMAWEVGRTSGPTNRLTERMAWEPGGHVRITVGTAEGYTSQSWPPSVVEVGMEPLLTPWGPERARLYAWEPRRRVFALERTEPNPTARPGTAPAAPDVPPAEIVPVAPLPADVEGTLALFHDREHIPADVRPAHRVQGDVAEDAAPETLQTYGRVLVVVGAHFMGGRAYYAMALPVETGEDVLGVQLADITGDGKAEALVRVRRRLQAQVRGQTLVVEKELLLAYTIEAPHRGRVFGAEVARRVGAEDVTNEVSLPRGTGDLAITAGTARGWTEATYPFHDGPMPGIEALLLPWAMPRRRTYHWNGSAMAPMP